MPVTGNCAVSSKQDRSTAPTTLFYKRSGPETYRGRLTGLDGPGKHDFLIPLSVVSPVPFFIKVEDVI